MWLTPCSSSNSSARSASRFGTSPSAAAPKITLEDSCPVAPKGARSIMRGDYAPESAFEAANTHPALRPDQQHAAWHVVDDEARGRPEALRPRPALAVATEHDQVGVRTGVDDLVLDVSAAGHRAGGAPEP